MLLDGQQALADAGRSRTGRLNPPSRGARLRGVALRIFELCLGSLGGHLRFGRLDHRCLRLRTALQDLRLGQLGRGW